jgi:hypothetical protein
MNNIPETHKNNIAHLKDYADSYHKKISEDSDRIDSKFIGVIGFSSLLLKLSDDLSGNSCLELVLKVVACLFFIGAVGCCLRGLRPQVSTTEDPRSFRKEMYSEDYKNNPEYFELGISDALIQTSEQIRRVTNEKAEYLQSSIVSLSLGAFLMAANIILKSLAEYSG